MNLSFPDYKKLLIALIFGFFITILLNNVIVFSVTSDKPATCESYSGIGIQFCPENKYATSRVGGFPFASREAVYNPEDGTDDLRYGVSNNVRLNKPGTISKTHYDEHFNLDNFSYPKGFILNVLFWTMISFAGITLIQRKK